MKAIDITDTNFEEFVLNSGKPVLVDFGAEWCPPCKAMTPVIERIAEGLERKLSSESLTWIQIPNPQHGME